MKLPWEAKLSRTPQPSLLRQEARRRAVRHRLIERPNASGEGDMSSASNAATRDQSLTARWPTAWRSNQQRRESCQESRDIEMAPNNRRPRLHRGARRTRFR